jgi:translation initiation factor IF-3
VAPNANPPVCRIMDYGKFKFDEAQKAKESRRKTTSTSIKEMKYRPKIGTGDFDTKTRQVSRFLSEGHKVKITIMFRGREMSHPELGKRILDHVAEQVGSFAKVEAAPKLDGRNMIMVLAPDRRAQQAATAQQAKDGDQPEGSEVATPATRAPAQVSARAAVSEAVRASGANFQRGPTGPRSAPASPGPAPSRVPTGPGSASPEGVAASRVSNGPIRTSNPAATPTGPRPAPAPNPPTQPVAQEH